MHIQKSNRLADTLNYGCGDRVPTRLSGQDGEGVSAVILTVCRHTSRKTAGEETRQGCSWLTLQEAAHFHRPHARLGCGLVAF